MQRPRLESLEEVFAAVTEQEDYAAKAEAILNAATDDSPRIPRPDAPFRRRNRRPPTLRCRHRRVPANPDFGGVFSSVSADSCRASLQRNTCLLSNAVARAVLAAWPGDTLFTLALPMYFIGFAAVIVSPMLFPDETDYRVLTPLPLKRVSCLPPNSPPCSSSPRPQS